MTEDTASRLAAVTHNASTEEPVRLEPAGGPHVGYFKLVYVSDEIDTARRALTDAYGLTELRRERREIAVPGSDQPAVVDVDMAWLGELLVELVDPIEDPAGYFRVEGTSQLRVHHLGRLYGDHAQWRAAADRHVAAGRDVAILEDGPDVARFSLDARNVLGHRIEGVILDEDALKSLHSAPRLDVGGAAGESSSAASPAPLPGFYQMCYVTNDFQRALAEFRSLHDSDTWLEILPLPLILVDGQPGEVDAAFCYFGAVEIELMGPRSGAVGIYRDFLPADDFAIRHHHLSRRFSDFDTLDRRIAALAPTKHGVLCDNFPGSDDRTRFFYSDFRDELGHYLEGTAFESSALSWVWTFPRA